MKELGMDFFTRHSKQPKINEESSKEYPGLSEAGVELARERSRDILELLKKAEPGTVMFIAGTSDQIRTESTILVYGHEMKNLLTKEDDSDIELVLAEELKRVEGYFALLNKLVTKPDKKIALVLPQYVPELSWKGEFLTEEGKWGAYALELKKRNNDNSEEVLRDWLLTQGELDGLQGPNPKVVAEKQLTVLRKLRRWGNKYLPGRKLIIGAVGHSWTLDALAIYLANDGEVTLENYDKMREHGLLKETGMIALKHEDGKPVLQYGDLLIPLEK